MVEAEVGRSLVDESVEIGNYLLSALANSGLAPTTNSTSRAEMNTTSPLFFGQENQLYIMNGPRL